MKRCSWAETTPLEVQYHDSEWGVPSFCDTYLFEMLTLEGAQAGLSWSTILNKREGYRANFSQFDVRMVSRFTPAYVEKLLAKPEIVRHRGKIESTINNARATIAIQEKHGSLSDFLWQFVDHQPVINRWKQVKQIPAATPTSETMSKNLKKHGFRFVGPTTCYAFMQAVGMVNDHVQSCFRYQELA